MADITELEVFDQEDTQKEKYLTFALSNELYGIEIKHVTEIIGIQQIVELPELPNYFRGIINLRGKIVPVMDVRLRFNKEFRDYNDRTCVIVIDIGGVSMGLIVDSVSEVLTIPSSEIVPPPDVAKGGNRYINGIGKVGNEVKLLLNCDKLLYDEDADRMMSIL
ncbi:MAG: CheW protein [Herbinix sp.]|jgi:purine-binding chemotaxis protein CheW|nr:CheW protein [Herbinix sp.]